MNTQQIPRSMSTDILFSNGKLVEPDLRIVEEAMEAEAKAKSREEIMEALFIRLQELPTEWLEDTVEQIRNYDAKVDIEQVAALMFLCGKKFADEIQSAAMLLCKIHPAVEETYIIGTDALRQQHLAWYKAELERRSNAPAADPRDDC